MNSECPCHFRWLINNTVSVENTLVDVWDPPASREGVASISIGLMPRLVASFHGVAVHRNPFLPWIDQVPSLFHYSHPALSWPTVPNI